MFMPDPWRVFSLLAWLLPARLCDRVFEPACFDLFAESLEQRRRSTLVLSRMMGILLYVVVVNLPGILIENGRPSRLGMLVGMASMSGILIGVAGVAYLRLAGGY